jgi:hypothetical protein
MTVAITQPYLYPYIGYWQLINAVDKFVILDDVNYINRGWINRNRIPAGRFVLSLKDKSQNKLIKDLYITGETKSFFELIRHTYHRSKHYDEVVDNIAVSGNMISGVCYFSIVKMCKYLGIQTDVIPSSAGFTHEGLTGQERLIDICHQLGATRYINPQNGQALYDYERFAMFGVELKFLKCNVENKFSIIDLLMIEGRDRVKEMLNEYELL